MQTRKAFFKSVSDSSRQVYADDFLASTMQEARFVTQKQVDVFKRTNGQAKVVDRPLGELIQYLMSTDEQKLVQESNDQLKNQLQLNEQLYYSHVVKGHAEKEMWPQIVNLIKMQPCPVPYVTIGEILNAAENTDLARDSFVKIQDPEVRIEKLLEYKFWIPAMDEIIKTRLYEDFEHRMIGLARSENASWVISEWQRKKNIALR